MTYPVRDARRRIRREHAAVVSGVDRCADAVVDSWGQGSEEVPDREAVVVPFRRRLEEAGLLSALPRALADAVDATGFDLRAKPVPAPPYVIVTSRGPILRATIEPGRLVIRFEAFEVCRNPTPTYRRLEGVRLTVSLE